MKLLSLFSHTSILLVGGAIVLGFFFAELFAPFAVFSTVLLGAIFFFVSLELEMETVRRALFDLKLIALVTLTMLVGLPLIVFAVTSFFAPSLTVPFVLLAAMPTGMTAPVVASIAGGRTAFVAVAAVITSLFAPLTIPFMLSILVGSAVVVEIVPMLLSLIKVICIPFILGRIVRALIPSAMHPGAVVRFFSHLLLGMLIMVIVAKQTSALDAMGWSVELLETVWYSLIVLACLFVFLHTLGYVAGRFFPGADRMSLMISLTYMNFTLAIFLADTYFPETDILIPVFLSVIPWALSLIPLQWLSHRHASFERKAEAKG